MPTTTYTQQQYPQQQFGQRPSQGQAPQMVPRPPTMRPQNGQKGQFAQRPPYPIHPGNPATVQGLTNGAGYINNQIPRQQPGQQMVAAALTEVPKSDAAATAAPLQPTTEAKYTLPTNTQQNTATAATGTANQAEPTMTTPQAAAVNMMQSFTNPMVDTQTMAAFDMGHGWQPFVGDIGADGYNHNPQGEYPYGNTYFQ